MCRSRAPIAALAVLALLAVACSREEPRTIVLDPATGQPRLNASAAGAPLPAATAPAPQAQAQAPQAQAPAPLPLPPEPPQQQAPQAARDSTPTAAAAAASADDTASLLAARRPMIPVEGIPPEALRDTYTQERGPGKHEAIDIMAPRGARVFAVDDGPLVKLFKSVPGGLTVYQFDQQGQLAYYYAHLDRYADGLKEGMALRRGDLIGYVGTSGNAAPDSPHLHFAVFRLGPEKQWWKGEPVNPYPALRQAAR